MLISKNTIGCVVLGKTNSPCIGCLVSEPRFSKLTQPTRLNKPFCLGWLAVLKFLGKNLGWSKQDFSDWYTTVNLCARTFVSGLRSRYRMYIIIPSVFHYHTDVWRFTEFFFDVFTKESFNMKKFTEAQLQLVRSTVLILLNSCFILDCKNCMQIYNLWHCLSITCFK